MGSSEARDEGTRTRNRMRVPLSPAADLVRQAVAERSQELDELCPAAVDIEAEVVAALHGKLHGTGDATALRGNRGPGYFRQQLRGEHPVTVGDLARLALDAPDAVVAALSILARHLGYDLAALDPTELTLGAAAAGVARSAGDLQAEVIEATADGVVDEGERARLRSLVDSTQERVAELQAALDAPTVPLRAVGGARR
jgi:hypothetical protein